MAQRSCKLSDYDDERLRRLAARWGIHGPILGDAVRRIVLERLAIEDIHQQNKETYPLKEIISDDLKSKTVKDKEQQICELDPFAHLRDRISTKKHRQMTQTQKNLLHKSYHVLAHAVWLSDDRETTFQRQNIITLKQGYDLKPRQLQILEDKWEKFCSENIKHWEAESLKLPERELDETSGTEYGA